MKKFLTLVMVCIMSITLIACGNSSDTENTNSPKEETRNEEIVFDEPITLIDTDGVVIKATCFFREVLNEGSEDEFCQAGFELEVENKLVDYQINVFPTNCSLSDRRVIEFADGSGIGSVAPEKIATMRFIKYENGESVDIEDLNSLYELEGYLDITVHDDQYSYSDLSGVVEFSIPASMN